MEPTLSLKLPVIAFFVTLAVRAMCSFLETSVTALRLFKLKELEASMKQFSNLFQVLEKTPHRVLITILIANNLADVTVAALGTTMMERLFMQLHLSSSVGFSLGIGLATIAILVFGEILPKSIAKRFGERMLHSTIFLRLLTFLYYAFYPITSILIAISDFVVGKLAGEDVEAGSEWVSSEKEIQFLIEHINEKGLMETEKTEMLQNIFDLGHTPVREIMVPATDIISVDVKSSIKEILAIFSERHFTRLPVYENTPENIIGMVHLKDVFLVISRGEDKPLKSLIRPILFVPESVKINQLLREFRQQHMHIAMVINEHGSITGLITLEDVLEEIVGEIVDEHELAAEKVVQLKQGGWLVDASMPLEELSEHINLDFEAESSHTLGGFLTEQLQHLPKKGERILYKGYYFQVQKASQKRVLQVLVFKSDSVQPLI